MNYLIIAKHGERLDAVQPEKLWENYCTGQCGNSFELFCRLNDPPLTRRGNQQAKQLALTLQRDVRDVCSMQYIFASKLLRSVETACEIALILDKPVVLSKVFSQSVEAVQQNSTFDFISIDELESWYPGVRFIDGDCEEAAEVSLPFDHWTDAIEYLTTHFPLSLVICHGENIRCMLDSSVHTPCCSYGVFAVPDRLTSGNLQLSLERLCDNTGALLDRSKAFVESPLNKKKRKSPEEGGDELGDDGGGSDLEVTLPSLPGGGLSQLMRYRARKAGRSRHKGVLAFSHDMEVEDCAGVGSIFPHIADMSATNSSLSWTSLCRQEGDGGGHVAQP